MVEEELNRRKQRNKKIIKWFLLGNLIVGTIMIIAGAIIGKMTEGEQQELRAKQEAENRTKAERQAIVQARHDSLMRTNKSYADSVHRADKLRADSLTAARRQDSIDAMETDRRENPEKHLDVDFNWQKGGFGSVALAKVKFNNKSLKTCVNPVLLVTFYSDNGSVLSNRRETVYVTIPAGKKKRSEELNLGFISGQVTRAGAKLISADWE